MLNWLFPSPSEAATQAWSPEEMQAMFDKYYGPYIEAGMRAMPTLEEQYNLLLTNPTAVNEMLASGFQTSPGYDFQMEQAMNAANMAGAAGGMAGTPAHQQQAMGYAQGLANQDYWNYMNQMTGLYGTGLGVAQDINQMGYGASTGAAQGMGNYMGALMGMEYSAQQSQNDMLASLLGGAASIFF